MKIVTTIYTHLGIRTRLAWEYMTAIIVKPIIGFDNTLLSQICNIDLYESVCMY